MGKKALKKVFFDYMERNPEVDGIFCTSDMIAAQLFSGMSVHETDLYRKIPVIGFDGFDADQEDWRENRTRETDIAGEIDTAVKYRTFSWKAGKIIKKKNEAVFTKAASFFFFISPLQNRL